MNWTKQSLKNKGATIDMKCDDAESFKWAVTRSLNPLVKNSERVTKTLREQSKKCNWDGILFPTTIEQIETFEKNNDLLINVFGLDEGRFSICALRAFRGSHVGRVSLMLLDGRYLIVKSISRLLCGQVTKRRCKRFYCNSCLRSFPSEGKLERHIVLGCDPERVECDLCSKQKKINCPFHLNLNDVSGDRLRYVEKIREYTLDSKKTFDAFLVCEGGVYSPTLRSGVWVYDYMWEGERGYVDGVEYTCQECVVNGLLNCKCSMRGDSCDLCRRQGRSSCHLHMESVDTKRLKKALDRSRETTLFVRMSSKGEIYRPDLKGGRWVLSYLGKSEKGLDVFDDSSRI